ncbi:MAG: hypothetical protein L6Q47_11770 [Ignavibacteriaceae bacterium]|nr:hypothetical protein [Ignavibacteriaceae bacterium]
MNILIALIAIPLLLLLILYLIRLGLKLWAKGIVLIPQTMRGKIFTILSYVGYKFILVVLGLFIVMFIMNLFEERDEDKIRYQCIAYTQEGYQCKRLAQDQSEYCWQHSAELDEKRELPNDEPSIVETTKTSFWLWLVTFGIAILAPFILLIFIIPFFVYAKILEYFQIVKEKLQKKFL